MPLHLLWLDNCIFLLFLLVVAAHGVVCVYDNILYIFYWLLLHMVWCVSVTVFSIFSVGCYGTCMVCVLDIPPTSSCIYIPHLH